MPQKGSWLVAGLAVFILAGCSQKETTKAEPPAAEPPPTITPSAPTSGSEPTAVKVEPGKPGGLTELKIEDVKEGTGPVAEKGDLVMMIYTGKLLDGKVFDSNAGPEKAPFPVRVGAGEVIKGWDLGLPGMKVGGKRTLGIPSALAYGSQAQGDIPANSDLYFDVELLDIVKQGESNIYDRWKLKPGSGPEAKTGDQVTIHYTETLTNGKKVFSTPKDKPVKFVIGRQTVVPGIDAAMKGAKKGMVIKLKVPPDLAHGAQGTEQVPPNQIVIYQIEVVKIEPAGTFK